jgi:hexosaminidase
MTNVIPAPFRIESGSGELVLQPGAGIAYGDASLAPIIDRFARETARRCGLRLETLHPESEAGATPMLTIKLGEIDGFTTLPDTTGVSPLGDAIPDERYALNIGARGIELIAREPVGVARGLTTLLQLLATSPVHDGVVTLPAQRILDVPRYAWRSFSLDVGRRFLTVEEIKRLIDLLALYKFNVLNMHLTEDAGWRLPFGRPADAQNPADADDPFYTIADLRELDRYAVERFITIVPELDAPGHASAILKLRPELFSGRNRFDFEAVPGRVHYSCWFDPELPATFPFLESVWTEMADLFSSPYLNIGADEPFGMPHELYEAFLQRALPFVRSLGKRTTGWQESIRAGADPAHVITHWISVLTEDDLDYLYRRELSPEIIKNIVDSAQDIETAIAHSVPIIASPHLDTYLDIPYAEPSQDLAQEETVQRLGNRVYPSKSIEAMFDWDPGTLYGPGNGTAIVAGVACAIWGETVSDFDDVMFLVLPRLAGIAQKAWTVTKPGDWEQHRDALAWHGRLWDQDALPYFRSSLIAWR